MAGKKARCPECNAVCDIPPLNKEVAEVPDKLTGQERGPAARSEASAPSETRSAPAQAETRDSSSELVIEPVPKGWLMTLAVPSGLIALAVILFVFRMVDIAIICFALGIISFAAASVMYCFGLGKK